MQAPVQITFRHMEPSNAVRVRVLELVQRLERFNGRITRCQVVVERRRSINATALLLQ